MINDVKLSSKGTSMKLLPVLLILVKIQVNVGLIDSDVEVVAQLANQTLIALGDFFQGCDQAPKYQVKGCFKDLFEKLKKTYKSLMEAWHAQLNQSHKNMVK